MSLLLLVYDQWFMIIAFPLAKVAVYIVNGNISPVFLWNSNISISKRAM